MSQAAARPSALIVQDDEYVRFLLEFMLKREGFSVVCCADGGAASDHVGREPPAGIVIADLVLPYCDGFELIGQIRRSPGWRHVPVIVLSAHSVDRDIVRALEAGANDFVTKPYNARELMARIRRHMQLAERLSA